MIRLYRLSVPALLSLILLLSLTSCNYQQTPAEEIELKLEEYRAMVLELQDVMSQLKNKEISADEAQQKLGNHFVQELAEKENEVRTAIEENRKAIGDDKAIAFLSKLERYRQLGRVGAGSKSDKTDVKKMN